MSETNLLKHRLTIVFVFVLLAAISLAPTAMAQSPQPPEPPSPPQGQNPGLGAFPLRNGMQDVRPILPVLPDINATPSRKQKDAILKENFKSTERDVAKLNRLVEALQQEIKKSNSQVLSLRIVNQAGKVEKLAHKIKNELKAY
ncbi:MAG: hypothetical protein ACRD3D_09715 [Terriglobia bacterium]